ncbi:hypothetical protein [Aquihabitans sp. McL0605]|uniref:hypothetical protein n=1 Tax=Aquihabitans sp. McL0605 TaxID=3415671 RepID=UPI003CEB7580
MSDKSVFTDDEWQALSEAPLLISMAMSVVGPHGPISMIKESTASAKAIAAPADHGAANELIAEIIEVAKSKEARHDVKDHKASTLPAMVDTLLADLPAASSALKKLPDDEAAGVRAWLAHIAVAIAAAAKGTSPEEQAVIDRITAIFA